MVSAICIILLAISVSAISIAMRHFVVKLNERIDELDKFVLSNRDRVDTQLYDYYTDPGTYPILIPSRTIRGRLDDLTEDIDLLKQYLNVEKVDTPASTKYVKRKGE